MGQRYSVRLFFHIHRLEDALLATATIVTPLDNPVRVLLPSGREVWLPFKARLPFAYHEKRDFYEIHLGEYAPGSR